MGEYALIIALVAFVLIAAYAGFTTGVDGEVDLVVDTLADLGIRGTPGGGPGDLPPVGDDDIPPENPKPDPKPKPGTNTRPPVREGGPG